MIAMNCPECGTEMERGWLAIYGALEPIAHVFARVVWHTEEPPGIRVVAPQGAVNVVPSTLGGGGSAEAFLCRACHFVAFKY